MSWFTPIDAYCERTAPDYWSEPVNALTNLAFVAGAVIIWPRVQGPHMAMGRAMSVVLAVIGVGSWLFHTHANQATSLMDVVPIVSFILLYVFAATRDYFGLRPWVSGLITLGFLPYAALTTPLFAQIPGIGSSASYAPVPVLILIYSVLLRRRLPATSCGLAIGAGLLTLSLTLRTLDQPLCQALPIGTHFLWHLLNAAMLAWMIEVWRRHRLHQISRSR